MAIQPIDLQALFTQMDKVGKQEADQKDGLVAQQTAQSAHIQKQAEAKFLSVNEVPNPGEDNDRVRNDSRRKREERKGSRERDGEKKEEETASVEKVTDPNLGKNIDLSG